MKIVIILTTLLLFVNNNTIAQVGISTDNSAPDNSAMLDVKSTTSGILIPRMTTTERDNIGTPATGLTVYVTNDNTFYYYDGSSWVSLQKGKKSWLLEGNSQTTSSDFLGTTDANPLVIKTNNTERLRIKDNGVIGINVAPDDNVLINASSKAHSVIGSFMSTRENVDDIAIYGEVAKTDYRGFGGMFIGGFTGVSAWVSPTGSKDYFGVSSRVSGGSGSNFGFKSLVSNSGKNYGIYNTVRDDGSGTAINIGTFNYTEGENQNFGTYNDLQGNSENYGFVADLSGSGKNYGFLGSFKVSDQNGSIGFFDNSHVDGIGIFALASNIPNYYAPGNNGSAISATGGMLAIGGYTEIDDNNAICIEGSYQGSNDFDATGVLGYSVPNNGYGYGVRGTGGYMGIYGSAPSGYFAIFSNGDFYASGTKSFIIDHPQDPANKMLKHFSIESNEVLNVYRGVIKLDANGKAKIKMPSYFKSINKNFSYQLTPIGSAAPGLFISKEINSQGVFKIAGGQPGQKISWTVYAERNDPYLQQHPKQRQVEVLKKAKERGKYIMPELYKQPASKGIFYLDRKIQKFKRKKIKLTPPKINNEKMNQIKNKLKKRKQAIK